MLFWLTGAQAAHYSLGTEAIGYYPHYGWQASGAGQFQGFARELFDEFARQQAMELEYEVLPVKRLYQQFLMNQNLDFKYPDAPEWQQALRGQQHIFYSDTVIQYVDGIIARVDRPARSPLVRLGTIRGFSPLPFQQAIANNTIQLSEYSRVEDLLQAVLHRRIDGAYVNVEVALYQAKYTLAVKAMLCFNSDLPFVKDGYKMSSIKHPQLIAAFNTFLHDQHAWIVQLKTKYGLANSISTAAPLAGITVAPQQRCPK